MIQRFFHPVGQGAFYSERHISHNINIVYDCGTTNPSSVTKQRVVKQSFSNDDVIHILFISHFDKDHISLIDTLKNAVKRIERVIIPLLHDEEKIFLSNIYKALGHSSLGKLVSNPREFFGEETQIITIRPSSEDRPLEQIPVVNLSERHRENIEISSGVPLTINGLQDWVYIPLNFEYQKRSKEFQDELQKKGINIDMLKNDPNYVLNEDVKKAIKAIYKKISGNINQNSMFLYSGPLSKESSRHFWGERCWHGNIYNCHFACYDYDYCSYRVACLFTGDGDLNIVDVRNKYSLYWDLIGTIQIPHHGSWKSFKANALNNGPFLCPISVGNKNSYGHPSQRVISDILFRRSFPILVTEDLDSAFVEIIDNNF